MKTEMCVVARAVPIGFDDEGIEGRDDDVYYYNC